MRRTLIAALGLVALTTAACEKKPTGQTVAVVNGEEITSAELNAALQQTQTPPGIDKKVVTAGVLERLIDRKLLVQQAKEEGIDTTPDFINAQRKATEDLLIGMLSQRKTRTSGLPNADELASFKAKYPERFAQREVWDLNQVIYDTPEGEGLKAQIQQTKSIDQLISVLNANNIAFERKQAKLNTGTLPREIYAQIARLPAGEPFLVPNTDKTVASVIAGRQPAPLTGPESDQLAAQQLRQTEGTEKMTSQVDALRKKAKIEYKEGFKPAPKGAAKPAAEKAK